MRTRGRWAAGAFALGAVLGFLAALFAPPPRAELREVAADPFDDSRRESLNPLRVGN